MKNRWDMIPFELTAIDLILTIAVIVLIVLYWTKLSKIPDEQIFRGLIARDTNPEKVIANPQSGYTFERARAQCPRGFGDIRTIGDDGSVSERCLGCYRVMECYGESEKSEL